MLLLGIKCFLRADEVVNLTVEDFPSMSFTVLNPENAGFFKVKELALEVCGKCDKRAVTLLLHRDDKNPEFCLIRHLLLYMSQTNISSGFLFPDWNLELWPKLFQGNVLSPWCPETHVTYSNFLERVKVSTQILYNCFMFFFLTYSLTLFIAAPFYRV